MARKTTSVADNPVLLAQWDWENNTVSPSDITTGSHKKMWWVCKKGNITHRYTSVVCDKNRGRGCPYCAGKKVLPGFNDLETTYPELASQWDRDRNEILPCDITSGSRKKVWWVCEKSHLWQSSVSKRVEGNGCPYCAGKKVLPGFNDLKTTHPEIASQWDSDKNTVSSSDITSGSNKKAWWICDKGHSYSAMIVSRCSGSGCPYCHGRKPIKGVSDIAATHPQLALQWDYDKNSISVHDVSSGSKKKVWWVCDRGHHYQRSVMERKTSLPTQCYGKKDITTNAVLWKERMARGAPTALGKKFFQDLMM